MRTAALLVCWALCVWITSRSAQFSDDAGDLEHIRGSCYDKGSARTKSGHDLFCDHKYSIPSLCTETDPDACLAAGYATTPDGDTLAAKLRTEHAKIANLRARVELVQHMSDSRVFLFNTEWIIQAEKKRMDFACDALPHMNVAFAFNGWHSQMHNKGVRPHLITMTAVDEFQHLSLFARYSYPLLCFVSDRGQELFAPAPMDSLAEWATAPPEMVNAISCVPLILRVRKDLTEYTRHRNVSSQLTERLAAAAGEPLQTFWLDPTIRYLPRRIQRHPTLDQAELLIESIEYQQIGQFRLPLSAKLIQGPPNIGTWYSQSIQIASVAQPAIPDDEFVLPHGVDVMTESQIAGKQRLMPRRQYPLRAPWWDQVGRTLWPPANATRPTTAPTSAPANEGPG